MRTCMYCNEENIDDNERFCTSCGTDLDEANSNQHQNLKHDTIRNDDGENNELTLMNTIAGQLVMPGGKIIPIDYSQRSIGRADLVAYTENPDMVSRAHFTIYAENSKHIIKDGITNVQDRPSKIGTGVNDSIIDDETELKHGDKISVSDVVIMFEIRSKLQTDTGECTKGYESN